MGNITRILLLTLVGLLPGLAVSGGPQRKHPAHGHSAIATPSATPTPATSPLFVSIRMVTNKDGWAQAQGDKPYILHTYDGAATWKDVSPSGLAGDTVSAFFLDDTHAWIIGNFQVDSSGKVQQTIWATRDGGHSWVPATVKARHSAIQLLSFRDALHGAMILIDCCAASNIAFTNYATSNGGQSWRETASRVGNWLRYTDLAFAGPKDLWLTTGDAQNTVVGAVSVSHDGGHSFKDVDLPIPSDITTLDGCAPSKLFAFGPGSLTLFETCYDGNYQNDLRVYLYHTDNGGQSWLITPVQVSVNTLDFASEIESPEMVMINASTGWKIIQNNDDLTAASGVLYQTLDGGKTWTLIFSLPALGAKPIPPGCFTAASALDFIDANNGWAVDCTGLIEITHDSGKTWLQLNPKLSS